MTVLVTGAAGFVGVHVVRALALRGLRVRALVHQRPLGADSPADGVRGDLRVPATLDAACADVSCVVHLASVIADKTSSGSASTTGPGRPATAVAKARATSSGMRSGRSIS